MSKSYKHEKTQGFLDDLAKTRKVRRQVRALKTAMLNEIDMIANPPTIPTAEA
jgi:hypothetical protein